MDDQFLSLARSLLPDEAGPYELAAFAAMLRVMPIDTSPAETIWDPLRAPAHLLPLLGNELSVDLWDDTWPESKMRSVIEASPLLHDLKTSIEGYRRYLQIFDCRLIDYVAPPKGIILSQTQTPEEREAWLRELPELRIYTGVEYGTQDEGLYFDFGFLDVEPLLADRGRVLAARKARIYDPETGSLTQIGPVDFDVLTSDETTVMSERVFYPGAYDEAALTLDVAFLDLAFMIPLNPELAPVFTFKTSTTLGVSPTALLDALPHGFGSVDAQPQRVPLRRLMDNGVFLDTSPLDLAFFGTDLSPLGYYDAYKIAKVGKKVGSPLIDAGSFFDIDWYGWPSHTLHLLVDASRPTEVGTTLYLDSGFLDVNYMVPDDLSGLDHSIRASYVASGPGSDHVTLSTETTRYLTLSDGLRLDGSFKFGQRVARASA